MRAINKLVRKMLCGKAISIIAIVKMACMSFVSGSGPHTPLPRLEQPPLSPEDVRIDLPPFIMGPALLLPQPDTTLPFETKTPTPSTTTITDEPLSKISFEDVFYWDKEELSARHFQQNYCPLRCDGAERIDLKWIILPRTKVPLPKCIRCDCNRPSCEIYGLCCPDISELQFDIKKLLIPLENITKMLSGKDLTDIENHVHELSTVPVDRLIVEPATSTNIGQKNRGLTDKWSTQSPTLDVEDEPVVDSLPQAETISSALKFYCDVLNKNTLVIRSCPKDFPDPSISRMCENEVAEDEITLASYARVSDVVTGAVYYNEYCAKCNGIIEILPWEINVECDHNMYVYQATSDEELLKLGLHPDSDCYVTQLEPPNAPTVWCDWLFFSDNIIDKCNVTGLWPEYDEDVKQACEGDELSSLKYRMSESYSRNYKNVFCSICNSVSYPNIVSESGWLPPTRPKLPFSILLGFRRSAPDHENEVYRSPFTYSVNCSDTEWPSPNGDCLPFQCSPGKVLNGTKCITALDIITGLGYKLNLWFVPDENSIKDFTILDENNVHEEVLGAFHDEILSRLRGLARNYSLILYTLINASIDPSNVPDQSFINQPSSALKYELLYSWVTGEILANPELTRDAFESKVVDVFLNNSITIQLAKGKNITLKPSTIPNKFGTTEHCINFNLAHKTATCLIVFSRSRIMNLWLDGNYRPWENFLKVTNVLTCSFISFNKTMYEYSIITPDATTPPMVSIKLKLQVTNIIFSEAADLNHLAVDNDRTLKICHELLDKKLLEIDKQNERSFYRNSKFKSQSDTSSFAQYTVTLICMGASMICLALTLLTYFRFSELRSAAGRNNIFLCASLLLAQAMLLAATHVSGPSTLCTVFGIATHFVWLNVFCWSFVCCFHMFKVFTAKTRNLHSTARSQTMQLLKSVVLSVLVPGLVIATVIVASLFTSDKSEIGYGDNACYLDSNVLVGVSMIVPLALVTVCNISFFTITVIKIRNIRKLQTRGSFNKEDRQNLYIYIKLSTLTGVFWAIFIIAEALDADSLRFVAIVLNGLQGVFIFISYICNKRIVNLYLRSLGLETLTTTSSEKQAKTSKLASEMHQETKNKKSGHGRCDELNGAQNQPPIGMCDVDLEVDTENVRNERRSFEISSRCYRDPSLSNGTRCPADGSHEDKTEGAQEILEDVVDAESRSTP